MTAGTDDQTGDAGRGSVFNPPFLWAYWIYRVIYGTRRRPGRFFVLACALLSAVLGAAWAVAWYVNSLLDKGWVSLADSVSQSGIRAADSGDVSIVLARIHGRLVQVVVQGTHAVGSHVPLWMKGASIGAHDPEGTNGVTYLIAVILGLVLFILLMAFLGDMRLGRNRHKYDNLFGERRRRAEARWDQRLHRKTPQTIGELLELLRAHPHRMLRSVVADALPVNVAASGFLDRTFGENLGRPASRLEPMVANTAHPDHDLACTAAVATLQRARVVALSFRVGQLLTPADADM